MMKEGRTRPYYGETSLKSSEPPFNKEITEAPLPSRFKMPAFERYEGSSDPIDHLDNFKMLMQLQRAPNAIMCRAFATTLKGTARDWYRTLRPGSIGSFQEMEQMFTGHFLSSWRVAKTTGHLMSIVQGDQETLKNFMHRFNTATLEIRNLDMGVALAALTTALQPGSFLHSLGKKPPVDMGELMIQAEKYINLEEMMDTRGNRIERKRGNNNRESGDTCRSVKRHETSALQKGQKMRGQHDKRGHLSKFIKKENPEREPLEQRRHGAKEKEEQVIGEITVIFGGSASGEDSGSARKRYAKQVLTMEKGETSSKRNRRDDVVTFDSGDEQGVQQLHDDALVLSLLVTNYMVRRILIDNGSSANIMFWLVLVGMKIGKERLKPVSTPLVGFGGDTVHPLGKITLPVTIGTTPQQVTMLTEFLVVDRPSVYNVILGRPFLNAVRAVTSTYHLRVKFPTPQGIGSAKGDQVVAWSCYVMALKGKVEAKEALTVEDLEVRGEYPQISTLHEDIKHIPLRGHQERSIQIGNHLPDTLKAELTKLLDEFSDLFHWSAAYMPGIDPAVIEHRLQVNPNH
ncbi:uncharacterized protein LOC131147587 [Malania oleifera]|uniref:uncharacterized protein LOC131147587 n=1 Tax=Malania oleifera TaxID=397392 RepID=UPI0025AE8A73|nr:uncharacterized protein LOC131147587 [Malania oleifera]